MGLERIILDWINSVECDINADDIIILHSTYPNEYYLFHLQIQEL